METQIFYFRPNVADGLWCSVLVPISLLTTNYRNSDTGIHSVTIFLSIIFLMPFQFGPKKFPYDKMEISTNRGVNIASLISLFVLHKMTDYRLMTLLITILAAPYIFDYFLKTITISCRYCFTVGEAVIVSQALTLFVVSCFLSFEEFRRKGDRFPGEVVECTKFLQILLLGAIGVILILHQFPCWRIVYWFYTLCTAVGLVILLSWVVYLEHNPVLWLFQTCASSHIRISLLFSWVALVMASGLFAGNIQMFVSTPNSSLLRKYFHLIIISTYVPGLIFDINLLYLSSGVALTVFAVLETFRVLEIPPVGDNIKETFSMFIDEKDTGVLILSHIYLLVGCSCPLWLYPPQNGLHLSHWGGIISVGLGDMVAAAAGSTFGRHRWHGSKKTIEGTIFAVIAQSAALCAILNWSDMLNLKNTSLAFLAALITSITEAKTEQNDNLVLPFVMFPILSFIS